MESSVKFQKLRKWNKYDVKVDPGRCNLLKFIAILPSYPLL